MPSHDTSRQPNSSMSVHPCTDLSFSLFTACHLASYGPDPYPANTICTTCPYVLYVYFGQVLFATPHADVVPFLTPVFVLSLKAVHATDADSSLPKTMRFAGTLRWNSLHTSKPRVTFRCKSRINLQPYANTEPEDFWECPAEAEAVS